MAFNSRFFRVYAVVADQFGIDPLLDLVVAEIAKIKSYTNHEVTVAERGAPDLLSFNAYGTELFWWHILTYNGICRYADVVEGTTIRIPDYGSLIEVVNNAQASTSSSINTVTI